MTHKCCLKSLLDDVASRVVAARLIARPDYMEYVFGVVETRKYNLIRIIFKSLETMLLKLHTESFKQWKIVPKKLFLSNLYKNVEFCYTCSIIK